MDSKRWVKNTKNVSRWLILSMALALLPVGMAQAAPARPQNLEPSIGASNVYKNPTLEISCNDPEVVAARYVISTNSDFSNPVYDSLESVNDFCSHLAFAELDPSTQYYWRARVRDDQGDWSSWSISSSFVTSSGSSVFFNVFQDGVANYNGTVDVDIRGSGVDPLQVIREWNQGKQDVLRTGRRPTGRPTDEIYRSLLEFDLTSLTNPNAVISVYLELTGHIHGPPRDNEVFNGRNSVYQTLKDWEEGNGVKDVDAVTGEASWTYTDLPNEWNIRGAADASDTDPNADRTATPLAQAIVTNQPGYRSIWSSKAMVDMVKQWIANPSTNHGFFFQSNDESVRKTLHWASREASDPDVRPRLVVISRQRAFPTQNQPPIAVRDEAITDLNAQVSIPVLSNDFDKDGSPMVLTIDSVSTPENGVANIVGDEIVYLPDAGFSGVDTFWYKITDGEATASAMAFVDVGQMGAGTQTPMATDDNYGSQPDTALTVAAPGVLGNDSDPNGDPLTAQLDTNPNHGTITLNTDGSFTYVPNGGFSGTDTFTYRAHDGSLVSESATVKLTVVPPGGVAVTVSFRQGENGFSATYDTFILGSNPTKSSASRPLSKWNVSDSKYALVRFENIFGGGTGQIPDGVTIQEATLTLAVYDDGDAADIYDAGVPWAENVTFATFGGDPDIQVEELGALVQGATGEQVSVGSYNVDVTQSLSRWNTNPNTNNGWVFMPTGTNGVDFRTSEYGTTVDRPTLTVTYVIGGSSGGNQAPIGNNDAYNGNQGSAMTVNAPGVLGNDSDPEGDPLTALLDTSPSNGTMTLNPDGSFTYNPNVGFSGTDTFTYYANDNDLDSNIATVTLNINQAPVANDDSTNASINTPITIAVLTNDTDDTGLDAVSVLVQSGPSNGSTSVDTNTGAITYSPNLGYVGSDSFSYTVRDIQGLESNVATVSVTVVDDNVAPVANDDSANTSIDTPIAVAVLTNDTDAGGLNVGSVLVQSGATNGSTSVNTNTGVITYSPNLGYVGSDNFTYTVRDTQGLESNVATVSVAVIDDNVAPVATNDSYSGTQDTALTVAAPGVLGNDSDANGNPMTARLDTNPSNGTVTLNSDGSFTYVPNGGFSGNDSFTYFAHDGSLPSESVSVNLTIFPQGGNIVTVSFREGENGYSSTQDTFIQEDRPTKQSSARPVSKWGGAEVNYALVRFENIFGSGAEQIPAGATIQSATLDLTIFNSGDAADIHESAVPWAENVTYATFGGDTGVQGDELGALVRAAAGEHVNGGTFSINVTESLNRWLADPSSNHGWVFMQTGTNEVNFRTSEYGTTVERPTLTVTYVVGSGS